MIGGLKIRELMTRKLMIRGLMIRQRVDDWRVDDWLVSPCSFFNFEKSGTPRLFFLVQTWNEEFEPFAHKFHYFIRACVDPLFPKAAACLLLFV